MRGAGGENAGVAEAEWDSEIGGGEVRKATTWIGRHKGIAYEVTQHGISEHNPNGIFCGYLLLDSKHHPEILEKRGTPDWLERYKKELPKMEIHRHHDWWNRFDWNGGITYYDETETIGGTVRMKIGHDYAHLWDYERCNANYDPQHIEFRLKEIIDAYRELYPYEEKEL